MIKQKFIINIKEHEFELEKEELKKLFEELKEIFNIPNNTNFSQKINSNEIVSKPKNNIPSKLYSEDEPWWKDELSNKLKEINIPNK